MFITLVVAVVEPIIIHHLMNVVKAATVAVEMVAMVMLVVLELQTPEAVAAVVVTHLLLLTKVGLAPVVDQVLLLLGIGRAIDFI